MGWHTPTFGTCNIGQFLMSSFILYGETAVKRKVVQLSLFGTHIRHCLRIIDGTAPPPPH
jgi:hypothetical protein